MSGPTRLAAGGLIDRARPLRFSFDGEAFTGFAGDTIASALLGAGVRIVGRSFKCHRPRGIMAAGLEEPNAILDLRDGDRHDPNARATIEPLADGMVLRSIHADGTAARDRLAFLDRLQRFIPSGFYYKTFTRPRWEFWEDRIRALAGLGRLDPSARGRRGGVVNEHVDLLVVGSGPAGLAAALAALANGRKVMLVEAEAAVGGTLLWRQAMIDGVPGAAWAARAATRLEQGGAVVLTRAIAFGLYDHGLAGVVETATGRVRQVRAKEIIVAAGAIERPLLFADNDRPGVMLASAALAYLRRFGVRVGERALVATATDAGYETALALAEAGAEVAVIDSRAGSSLAARARAAGLEVRQRERIAAVEGARMVEAARLTSGARLPADLIAVSGGFTPTLHLYAQANGRPVWSAALGAPVPGEQVAGLGVVGAAAGATALQTALDQGHRAGGGSGDPPGASGDLLDVTGADGDVPREGRVFVDLQNDVTVKDIALAARENYVSVEHLKRYTTLGMATDQGKTSNVNGLAALAAATGRDIASLGVTTYRPPFAPVSIAALAGVMTGEAHAPPRRLPAEAAHRAEGAHFGAYGGILRPAWYGPDRETAVTQEVLAARRGAVVLDASPLGKIDVIGPQAEALVDFLFATPMASLKPGRLRYGLMLSEQGVIIDDAVVARLGPGHFLISASSGHVAAIAAHAEAWRQDRFDRTAVFVHDATAAVATMAISGPGSKAVVAALGLGIDLADAALPPMAFATGHFAGRPARIARVSFTGERAYEISVPAGEATALWQAARAAGAAPLGIEALLVLRAEKGFILPGRDTDGETMPHDLGLTGPATRRTPFVGDRSLDLPAARDPGRRELVGVMVEGRTPLAVGAHAFVPDGPSRRSLGFVTTSLFSPTLDRPVALALIRDGRARMGEALPFFDLGAVRMGTIAPVCAWDPEGARLNA